MPRKRKKKGQKKGGKKAASASAIAGRRAIDRDKAGLIEILGEFRTAEDSIGTKGSVSGRPIIRRTTAGLTTFKEDTEESELRIRAIPEGMPPEQIALILLRQIIGDDPESPLPFPKKIAFDVLMIGTTGIIDMLLQAAQEFYPIQDYQLREDEADKPDDRGTFTFDESALSYLASTLGITTEVLETYQKEGLRILDGIEEQREDYIIDSQELFERDINGFIIQQEKLGRSLPGSGRKAPAWALGSTRNEAKRLVAAYNERLRLRRERVNLFPAGNYSIHHKISRSRLRKLHQEMKSSVDARILLSAIEQIGTYLGTPSTLKAMLNMPANLEVGPSTANITGDLGARFDGNVQRRTRAYTIRSAGLAEVDVLIDREDKGPREWARIAELITRAHNDSHGRITEPNPDLWDSHESGKFIKIH